MNEDLDTFLREELLVLPQDFTQRVMRKIDELPIPALIEQPRRREKGLQWIAFIGTGLFGAVQLVAFIFGIWTATAAG